MVKKIKKRVRREYTKEDVKELRAHSKAVGATPVFDFTKASFDFQASTSRRLWTVNGRTSKLSRKRIRSLSRAGSASFVGKQKCSKRR